MAYTKQYTKPSAGRYILRLYQSYHYNRRVPKSAQKQFGRLIRFKLGGDRKLAKEQARDITRKLDTAWSQPLGNLVVDVGRCLTSSQRPDELLSWSHEYLSVKDIIPAPTRLGGVPLE